MAKTPLDQLGLINGNSLSQTELLAITDALIQRGPTADRPTSPRRFTGKVYFDTTINALIRWNGTDWIHAGLPVYASTAARDTAMPTPTAGAEAYVASNDAAEGPLFRASGSVWRPPWNLPWGVIGIVKVVIALTGTNTTPTDVGGMSISWTAIATRRYRVTLSASVIVTAGGGLYLTDGFNTISDQGFLPVVGVYQKLALQADYVGASGAVTVKIRYAVSSGSLTINPNNNTTTPAIFMVEDLGPAGAPA